MVKIKSVFIAITLAFVLVGCGAQKDKIVYVDRNVYVDVPVMQKIELEPIEKPVLPIDHLKKNATSREIVEAYYNSLKLCLEYQKQLEDTIKPFLKKEAQ